MAGSALVQPSGGTNQKADSSLLQVPDEQSAEVLPFAAEPPYILHARQFQRLLPHVVRGRSTAGRCHESLRAITIRSRPARSW